MRILNNYSDFRRNHTQIYEDLLLEKTLSLVMESEVHFSDELVKILKKIDDPISNKLLKVLGKDYDVASNYLDIADNKEHISFIPDKKAIELDNKIKEDNLRKFIGQSYSVVLGDVEFSKTLGIDPSELYSYSGESSGYWRPESGEICSIISVHVNNIDGTVWALVDFSGKRALVRKAELSTPDVLYWTKNRQQVRIGRLVRAMLKIAGEEFTDSQIEDFVNKYKAAWDWSQDAYRNFELVKGDEIAHWYSYTNYESFVTTTYLNNSCMAKASKNRFKIYTQNPEVCSLLILKSESDSEKISGRALVWKSNQGFYFMDRIYTNRESDIQLFRNYAVSKEWFYKRINDSNNEATFVGPNNRENYYISVTIKSLGYDEYPYMDTLKFLYESHPNYKLDNDAARNWDKTLESTGGGYRERCSLCDETLRVCCEYCSDGRVQCNECKRGLVDCGNCDDGKLICDRCDGSGEFEDEDGEKEECSKCSGSGEIDCKNCDDGKVECSQCGGDEYVTCNRCDGNGWCDCPECT